MSFQNNYPISRSTSKSDNMYMRDVTGVHGAALLYYFYTVDAAVL